MRPTRLAVAIALIAGTVTFNAAAQSAPSAQDIAELKAQIAALQAQIQNLEERNDAQSDVNVDTATQLDNLTNNSVKVETKGGLKVTSADKNFEASLGGRIHFDAYSFDKDVAATTDTTEFRRARLTL